MAFCWQALLEFTDTNTTVQRNRYRRCKRCFSINARSSRSFIRCQICLFKVTTRFDHTFPAWPPFFFPLIPVQRKHRVVVFSISACLRFAFHLYSHSPSPVTGSWPENSHALTAWCSFCIFFFPHLYIKHTFNNLELKALYIDMEANLASNFNERN